MTQNEYEHYRRRLDEQLASGIELLKAAHAQQVHALELVWKMVSSEEALRAAAPAPTPEAPAAAAASAPRSPRRGAQELINDVEAALPRLPEVFARQDVLQALGYEPDRSSLYRALQELVQKGILFKVSVGEGRVPTTYGKAGAAHSLANP